MKRRIAFGIFVIISVAILLYYNYSQSGLEVDYSRRVEMVIFIFAITFVCVAYIVYESYRVMYSEMKERMDMITASKNDLQTTYNSLSMFMMEIGSDYSILNLNEAVCRYLDRERFFAIGKNFDTILDFNVQAIELLKNLVDETFATGDNEKK